ncbi:MAG: hypothetical protein JNK64_27010 [Myxococcales bacterium]|nr:hypothetical protein [Myxococcales bacterium]
MSYRDDLDAARARRDALARELTDLRERLGDRATLEARERELAAAVLDANRRVDHARGQVKLPLLQEIRVASPCNERWDAMTGDDRMRFCGSCQQHVFDLSAMTTAEAEGFLRERTGTACVRFYRRADGTVLTADCPEGVRRRRRRRFAVAGAAVAVLASLAGGVARALTGRPPRKPPEHVMGAITPSRPPADAPAMPAADDPPPR